MRRSGRVNTPYRGRPLRSSMRGSDPANTNKSMNEGPKNEFGPEKVRNPRAVQQEPEDEVKIIDDTKETKEEVQDCVQSTEQPKTPEPTPDETPAEVVQTNNVKKEEEPEQITEESEKAKEEIKEQIPVTNSSATTKALECLMALKEERKLKKKVKLPVAIRRRRQNQRLNKILMPKSALILLHELKPGCIYKFQEHSGPNHSFFTTQVEYDGKVLAVGQGASKPSAKHSAAENAIKGLVAEVFANQTDKKPEEEAELMEADDEQASDLPWAGLASFALYKMFSEWQSQGADFPLIPLQPKKKPADAKVPAVRKELPPKAEKYHPSLLLNIMRPGTISSEISRTLKDNISTVNIGYTIDGTTYVGSGSNKKEARKEAAKAALRSLYGLKYDD